MKITLRYGLNLFGTACFAVLLFGASGLVWISHRQALDYVHPHRLAPPGGEFLR